MLIAAPLAIIEILSPEDRLKRVLTKLEDYRQMGVGSVVVVDPEDGRFYRYSAGSLDVIKDGIIRFGAGPVFLDRKALEELLD